MKEGRSPGDPAPPRPESGSPRRLGLCPSPRL